MKASRITAVGAGRRRRGCGSGPAIFLPHDSGESRAAIRSEAAAPEKLFRVAVARRTSLRTAAS